MECINLPISIRGRYFWKGEERLLIKGVVYKIEDGENGLVDPLADEHLDTLEQSLPLFRELGLNTLFVYSVDSTQDHSKAMELLARNAIYVLVGLATTRLLSTSVQESGLHAYTATLLRGYFATVDNMAAYSNVLGVLVTNASLYTTRNTATATVIRAVVRDVKRYASEMAMLRGQRVLPVGFRSSNGCKLVKHEFDFLTGGDQREALDFFCYDNWSWRGKSSLQMAGWDKQVEEFSNAHVPVFFSEYGCNNPMPRLFQDTLALHSSEMTGVFSGGCVYTFFEKPNLYGLVRISPCGYWIRKTDFSNLRASLAQSQDVQPHTLSQWADASYTAKRVPHMPPLSSLWLARSEDIPTCPLEWDAVHTRTEGVQ